MNAVDEERELRERLAGVAVPPSRLGVEALVLDGRRRRRRRRSAQAAIGAALTIAVLVAGPAVAFRPDQRPAPVVNVPTPKPSAKASAGPCRAVNLPVPAGMKDAVADAVDPTGRYIVGHGFSGQNFRPIMWTAGRAKIMAMPATSVQNTAVNSSGVVVGLLTQRATDSVFRYENGRYTKLRTPAGSWNVYPEPAINTAGDVVINAEPNGNSGGKDSIVLLWKAGRTSAKKLPLPQGANAMAILDDGTLIGTLYKDGVGVDGYAWDQQGHGRKLASRTGQTGAAYAGRGDWATGGQWPDQLPALWNLRTGKMSEFKTPPGADLAPALDGVGPGEAVNSQGWLVAGGYLFRQNGAATLPTPAGLTAAAADVSDTGLVVGTAKTANGTSGARTWQC